MNHALSVTRGAMGGHLGRFAWLNGSDLCRDDYENTLLTGGYCRFGSCFWLSTEPSPILVRLLGLR